MKYTLISLFLIPIIFASCSFSYDRSSSYKSVQNFEKKNCRNIINLDKRRECENTQIKSYKEYNKYLEKKSNN